MNVTKKLLGMALAVLPCALFADGPFAGQADGAVKSVATGVEQQSGAMSLSAEGEAYKTGLGAWALPWGALGSWELQNLVVKNGSLLLDLDDTTERAAERPNDVLGKALFWFDASFLADNPGFYNATDVDGRRYLNYIYDVRENFAGNVRQRPYAAANHYLRVVQEGKTDGDFNNTVLTWNVDKMPSPELVTRNGKTAIWFGGVGSGRSMSIYRAGEDGLSTAVDVVHVFAVTDSPDGWGAVFSPGFRPTGVWTGTPEYSWQVPILHIDECSRYTGNRTFFNGVRKDAQKDTPVKGYSLFECELYTIPVSVTRLFYAEVRSPGSNTIAPDDDGTRAVKVQCGGGDYAYELICFTNRLTGAERQRVVSYLQRKWFPNAEKKALVEGVVGATVTVKNSQDAVDVTTRRSGADLVKTGPGDLWFTRDTENLQEQVAPVTPSEGRVLTQRPVSFALEAGRRYAAEVLSNAVATSRSALAGDQAARIVKDGRADLMVRAVPETAKEIEVADGTLVVRPRGPSSRTDGLDTADDDVYIPIPNASFEERASGDENAAVINYKANTPYCGWVRLTQGDNRSVIYNVDKWPLDEPNSIMDGASRKTWGLTAYPHGGSALFLRNVGMDAGVRTAEPLDLAAGRYQIDFWTCGRGSTDGGMVDIVLIDPETLEETVVGRQWQIYTTTTGFGRVPCRFTVPESRSCYLGFRARVNGTDNMTAQLSIDDISLRRIASRPDSTEWTVPGGDFEATVATDDKTWESRTFTSAITHSNWTLTQPGAGTTDYDLGCGFANRYMYRFGVHEVACYNDSRAPFQSSILTFMLNGAAASTTFTPPKGSWYLKGDIAINGAANVGTISAKAVIGGVEHGLGSITPNNKIFSTFRFTGGKIESDGVTPVTLVLAYAATSATRSYNQPALYVDDLMLTKVLDDAKSSQGEPVFLHTFEDSSHNDWTVVGAASDNAGGGEFGYADQPTFSAAGDTLGNARGAYIRHNGGVVWTRDFQKAGTYRLSLFMNRTTNKAGTNPVHVWIARNGETNEFAVFRAGTQWRTERSAVFRIPEGDSYVYEVGLTGTYPGPRWTADDEYGERCSDTVIDNVTVARVGDEELVETDSVFAEDAQILVGAHGRLQLDFVGTNKVGLVRYGKRAISGLISAKTHPEFVSGSGALYREPPGFTIIVR